MIAERDDVWLPSKAQLDALAEELRAPKRPEMLSAMPPAGIR